MSQDIKKKEANADLAKENEALRLRLKALEEKEANADLAKENEALRLRLKALEEKEALKELEKEEQLKVSEEEKKILKQRAEIGRKMGLYNRYSQLYFLKNGGAKLDKASLAELVKLEGEVKQIDGVKSKITQRVAIGEEQMLLIKGIAIPESMLDHIKQLDKAAQKIYI